MKRRLFWFLVGAGSSAYVLTKGRKIYRQFTPEGVQEQVSARAEDAGRWVGDFTDTFAEARRRREDELADKFSRIERGRTP